MDPLLPNLLHVMVLMFDFGVSSVDSLSDANVSSWSTNVNFNSLVTTNQIHSLLIQHMSRLLLDGESAVQTNSSSSKWCQIISLVVYSEVN